MCPDVPSNSPKHGDESPRLNYTGARGTQGKGGCVIAASDHDAIPSHTVTVPLCILV